MLAICKGMNINIAVTIKKIIMHNNQDQTKNPTTKIIWIQFRVKGIPYRVGIRKFSNCFIYICCSGFDLQDMSADY